MADESKGEGPAGKIGGVDVASVVRSLRGESGGSAEPAPHPVDVNGVLLSAIQGLKGRLDEQAAELDEIAASLSRVTTPSGRDAKRVATPVAAPEILRKVAELEITTWSYKADDPSVRHIGPMAQDWYAAFGGSAGDKVISLVDAAGVCLAAIQALIALVEEQQSRIDDLKAELSRRD